MLTKAQLGASRATASRIADKYVSKGGVNKNPRERRDDQAFLLALADRRPRLVALAEIIDHALRLNAAGLKAARPAARAALADLRSILNI